MVLFSSVFFRLCVFLSSFCFLSLFVDILEDIEQADLR